MKSIFKNENLIFPAGKLKNTDIEIVHRDMKLFLSKNQKLGPFERHKPHLLFPSIYKLSNNEIIKNSVYNFLEKPFFLWYSVLFFKSKSSEEYIPWHYDEYFFSLLASKGCTVWIAVDDISDDMGPMEFCFDPISNFPHQTETNKNNILSRGNTSNFMPNKKSVIEKVCLKKGEFSIHSNNIWHRSGANKSNKDRIGVALRYITNDAKPYKLKFLKRGIVGENFNKRYFFHEKKPDNLLRPLRGSHLYSILISLIISSFGDNNRNFFDQIKDIFKFLFSVKGYRIVLNGIVSILSRKKNANKPEKNI